MTRLAVRAMVALLPPGFRTRQHDEWTSDLLVLTSPADRRRYLLGAARTLPLLRRAARRAPSAVELEVPSGVTDTAARVLLSGLLWTMLAFYLFVPLRYFAVDIPARLADSNNMLPTDPKDVWPLAGAPGPLFPLWAAFQLTAWGVALGSFFLLFAATVPGLIATAARRRHRNYAGLTLAFALSLTAAIITSLFFGFTGTEDRGFTAALLGLTALALAAFRPTLPRRTRILLTITGLSAAALPLWLATPTGADILTWWYD